MKPSVRMTLSLAALLTAAPLAAQDAYAPFGRDPSDPVSSFAARDKAGNEQHHMIRPANASKLSGIEGERCMPKTLLCFSLNESDEQGRPSLRVREWGGTSDRSLPLDLTSGEDDGLEIWTLGILRIPLDESEAVGEQMIVGVVARESQMYSGGGASSSVLWLYRIDYAGTNDAVARQLLSVPMGAHQAIRACFGEKDRKARRDACLDETAVEAMLLLDPDNEAGMPRLIYRVGSRTYPSDIPLRAPEDRPNQLAKTDLVERRDPVCSYERKIAWNPATLRYEFDRPAPDCRIYGLER